MRSERSPGANRRHPPLHEAADDGRAAGRNAARFPAVEPVARRAPLAIAFSDPRIATVGQDRQTLRETFGRGAFVTGEASFADQGRRRVMLKNQRLGHVYVDRVTRRFAGAEWFGPAAEPIGHLPAWRVQMRLSVDDMLAMPFFHPVVEEGLRTALRDAAAKLSSPRTITPS